MTSSYKSSTGLFENLFDENILPSKGRSGDKVISSNQIIFEFCQFFFTELDHSSLLIPNMEHLNIPSLPLVKKVGNIFIVQVPLQLLLEE